MSRQAADNGPQLPCLWCRASKYRSNLEHILPEGLGCPPWLVLEDGVCKACNNGLGHVDHPPPHVHAFGKGCEARFKLNCPDGPVELWDLVGDWTLAHLNELGGVIAAHLEDCCKVRSEIHG